MNKKLDVKKVIITIAIVFVIIFGIIIYLGKNEINKIYGTDTYTEEELEAERVQRIKETIEAKDNAIKMITEDEHIDLEEFLTIQNGMTYEEVKEIIGCDGTITSELGEKGTAYYTISYRWTGFEDYTSASLIFQNGKLASKMQIGLE